jgi:hypothetical protein
MLTYWSPLPGVADSGLYAGERWGHFSYSIPVAPGTYRLCLKFSEHSFGAGTPGGGGLGTRIFNVYCNGTALLSDFDIIEKAQGANRPVDVTFRHLKPNPQGKLLIQFIPVKNYAVVNAIEVVDES